MKTFAIIKIAGKGTRVNSSVPKQYIEVNGRPIFIFTLIPFNESDHVDVICVVCDAEHMNFVRKKCAEFGIEKAKYFCVGGKNGNASTFNGYNAIRCDLQDNDIIISHDGVRALVTEEIIADSVNVAKNYKAAIAAYSTTGNILFKDSEYKYIKREKILIAQTPISLIKLNFDRCASFFKTKDVNSQDAYAGLDDIAFALNIPIYKSKGSSLNFKITTDNDLIMFRALVEKKSDS